MCFTIGVKVLVIHPNFPAQMKHVITELAKNKANSVVFLTNPTNARIPGVKMAFVAKPNESKHPVHRYLTELQTHVYRGQAVFRACLQLRKDGFVPDVIWVHPGWGDALFVKEAYPDVPMINYAEFYYRGIGADVHFDPNDKVNPDTLARVRVKNSHLLLSLEACDLAICPTKWQASVQPKEFRSKIRIVHEGIDTKAIMPRKDVTYTLPNGTTLSRKDKVVTYIARNLEPYRGFPTFMDAVQTMTKSEPDLHVVIIGADGVSYGGKHKSGKSYKDVMIEKIKPDPDRVHFLGYIAHDDMHTVLQVSSVHVYLTYPFVLSWSFLESLASGCCVVASDTAPVREVIKHDHNGRLVDFFDSSAISEACLELIADKKTNDRYRKNARKTIEDHYALADLLPKHIDIVERIAKSASTR